MNGKVDKDVFARMSLDDKLLVIFDTLQAREGLCQERMAQVDGQVDKLHNRISSKRKIDGAISGAGGILGGMIAFFSSKLFGG